MKERIKNIISNRLTIIIIYALFCIIASFQSLAVRKTFVDGGLMYTGYNNYIIFEKSYQHLITDQNLYTLYPDEHWDLYKYTPSFSVFFGIFSILPDWLGLNLWNLLNGLVLLLAIYYLPRLDNYQKGLIAWLVLIEMMTSVQSEQSNALITGLTIMAFGLLEKNKSFYATLCIVISAFIKLFGIVGFALFLFYPQKGRSILYTLFWSVLLLLTPLVFVDVAQYMNLCSSYLSMLGNDHDISYGYSVMGWLHAWFGFEIDKKLVVGIGVLLFLLPLYKIQMYKDFMFKYLMLCSVLIWIVIFNHKAESPTFILATAGVTLWFVKSEKNILNIILFTLAFIFTSLSPTDLFPKTIRVDYVIPYVLKAVPCILIWFKIIYDLLTTEKENVTFQVAKE